MVCYPEVQRKAQAELASVVGRDRLPDFEIRDQLPYINAIIKETMRWQPVTPLGTLSTSLFYRLNLQLTQLFPTIPTLTTSTMVNTFLPGRSLWATHGTPCFF